MIFQRRFGPWALVAGATQGMGEQYSHQLAAKGLNILMLARGQQGLDEVSNNVRKQHNVQVETLAVDLGDNELAEELEQLTEGKEVGLLVYNATFSYIGEFLEEGLASQSLCLDVNCKGPLIFLNHLLPKMKASGRGGVILMSSMSGWQGSALVTNYAASKAYNTVLAEGLWEEMRVYGVRVMAVVTGATKTPSFNKQTPKDKAHTALPMLPKTVVEGAIKALEKGRGPTYIAGPVNKLVYTLLGKILSRKAAVEFISKATRKLYQES